MAETTVLLPVFNGEQYLRETINSVLDQTYTDFEFLFIDDGSTDNSLQIIEDYNDPRIRVLVNPERLKLSGALNLGIDEARGQYIARIDADDIALPDRLQRQVDYLNRHHDIGICGTGIEIFGQTKTRTDFFPADTASIRSYALFDCPFCHPSVMIRKRFLDKHQLRYDGSYYPTEDYELWARAIELFPTVNLKEVLLRYRLHDKSMTGADWDEMDKQAARVIKPLLQKFDQAFSDDQVQFHRNMGRGRSCRLSSLKEIVKAEKWLLSLLMINKDKQLYSEQSLAETIGLIWYRLCLNSSQLGMSVFTGYRKSTLSENGNNTRQLFTLLGSVLKNKFCRASGDR